MVRVLDLYSGMGGLSLGFALAVEGAEILGLDVDKYAVATYNLNLRRFNARAEVRDVLRWEPSGEYDIVMGGVPCQPYSVAQNPKYAKRGEAHPLYPTLPRFFDVILALKPRVFLMENVKGLVLGEHRRLFDRQLGRVTTEYRVAWRVVNAAYYGVPQRRERLLVLGVRKDQGIQPGFPGYTHAEVEGVDVLGRRIHRWVTLREAIGDLLPIPSEGLVLTHKRSLTERVLETTWRPTFTSEEPSFTLTASSKIKVVGRAGSREGYRYLPPESIERILRSGFKLVTHDPDKPAHTIITTSGKNTNTGVYLAEAWGSEVRYRYLTPAESLRVQGFPGWWRFPASVSLSEKYKLIGDAVPPILSYRFAAHVAKLLGWETREPPREEEWGLPYFRRAFADYLDDPIKAE